MADPAARGEVPLWEFRRSVVSHLQGTRAANLHLALRHVTGRVQVPLFTVVGVLAVASLAGCMSLIGCLWTMGVRQLEWPGITASTREARPRHAERIKAFEEVSYFPAEAPHALLIRLPNGTLLSSENITRESLAKPGESTVYVTQFSDPSRTWRLVSAGTGEIFVYVTVFGDGSECYNVRYKLGDLHVDFNGSEATCICVDGYWGPYKLFSVDRPPNSVPAIGLTPEKMYTLPVKEEELIDLFGEPEKDEVYFFVT